MARNQSQELCFICKQNKQPGLIIDSGYSLKIPQISLSNSLGAAFRYLNTYQSKFASSNASVVTTGIQLKIERIANPNSHAWMDTVLVSVKGRPIATFPTSPNSEEQIVFIPWDSASTLNSLKIVLDAGSVNLANGKRNELGSWKISTPDGRFEWSPLTIKGKIIGGSQYVYLPPKSVSASEYTAGKNLREPKGSL